MFFAYQFNPLLTGPPVGAGPTAWGGVCGGFSGGYGTSIGLDEPMIFILRNISAALDPMGALLPSWRTPTLQPCGAYGGQPGGTLQGTTGYYARLGFGVTFAGVTCTNSGGMGGVSSVALRNVGLNGSVPYELVKLRTATTFDLSYQFLTGTLPQAWGQQIQWTSFSASAGFDSVTSLVVAQNSISGQLPPLLGSIGGGSPGALHVCDNLVRRRDTAAERPRRLAPRRPTAC